ncbi:PREDICTED: uncharacterized protein C2orf78-like isoform X2 [Chinchilla lanigera]|uniref:uncharacterized protein C2orf78-like isoform X2 n=1 Tax=Chinchilla lanigera TaxID=34839 RepID=UPI00038EA77C|nr:PREDICTED: uncharacterized protein C2orf78-like isoform X2 [Chinchilla lanigera]
MSGKKTSPEIETSLEWQVPSQAPYVPQPLEFPESCTSRSAHLLDRSPSTEVGDISKRASLQTSTHLLALDTTQEQPEKQNPDEMRSKHARLLDAHHILAGNQDLPLLTLATHGPLQLMPSGDPPSQEKSGSEDALWSKCHLSLQDPGNLDKGSKCSPGWADVAVLVEDIHLPQIFHPLEDLDQCNHPTAIKAGDTRVIKVNKVQGNSGIPKGPSPQVRKNKYKTFRPITEAPEAKVRLKDPESLVRGEELICSGAASDRASMDMAKSRNSKPLSVAASRNSQAKGCGQARAKRIRENKSNKLKEEGKPIIHCMKRKRNQFAMGQEAFKMPRTCLGMHMLESVQVFHPLGRKADKIAGSFPSWALGKLSITKDPKTSPTSKPYQRAPQEGKGLENAQECSQNQHSSAKTEDSSASLCKFPPPGQVKLIPLRFPSPEKLQARPVSRRAQRPASRRPNATYSVQAAATNSTAQPSNLAAAHTSLLSPGKPTQPVLENASQPHWTTSKQPGLSQSATSKPAPQETAPSASLRRGPVAAAVTKHKPLPQSQHPFLLQDFSHQPIPWREPTVPQPVMSSPIRAEQRPEREALKKQAQQERELAAKCTSLGKLQFFRQREKDREIAQYYGYAR